MRHKKTLHVSSELSVSLASGAAAVLGHLGGKASSALPSSPAKQKASRENGKRGGRRWVRGEEDGKAVMPWYRWYQQTREGLKAHGVYRVARDVYCEQWLRGLTPHDAVSQIRRWHETERIG